MLKEIQSLQMQHQVIQSGLQATNESLEHSLAKERKIRAVAEEDCQHKNNVSFGRFKNSMVKKKVYTNIYFILGAS